MLCGLGGSIHRAFEGGTRAARGFGVSESKLGAPFWEVLGLQGSGCKLASCSGTECKFKLPSKGNHVILPYMFFTKDA